jgi:dTDP-4-amino-4,6-dideoxygalactose transaminase
MALMAYGVGPGDAIFTTPFTFVATAEVISLLGATPVFVDIEPDTFNLDPRKLEEAISALEERNPQRDPLPAGSEKLVPKGIIAVDLFGQPAEYKSITPWPGTGAFSS